jgi:hypothetical protein
MAFASMIDQTAICITTVSLLCSPRRKKPTSTGALSDSIVLNADSVLRTRTHTHTHTHKSHAATASIFKAFGS